MENKLSKGGSLRIKSPQLYHLSAPRKSTTSRPAPHKRAGDGSEKGSAEGVVRGFDPGVPATWRIAEMLRWAGASCEATHPRHAAAFRARALEIDERGEGTPLPPADPTFEAFRAALALGVEVELRTERTREGKAFYLARPTRPIDGWIKGASCSGSSTEPAQAIRFLLAMVRS